jgi:hypothetical protein
MSIGVSARSAGWVALVWVSRRPGCKLYHINIACSCYTVGVVCFALWEVPTSPSAELVAQMFKGAGKWMWRPKHVVLVEGCGSVASGAMTGVVAAVGPVEDVRQLHPVA